ncbi:MAG: hypothetical protein R3Y23_05365 [Bacillota bacterium]
MKSKLYNILIILLMLAISIIFVGCQAETVVSTEDEAATVATVEEEVITYSKISVYMTDENGEIIYSSVKKDTVQDNLADLLSKLNSNSAYMDLKMTNDGYGKYLLYYSITEKIWVDGVATKGESTKYPLTGEQEDGTIPETTEVVVYTSITDIAYIAPGHTLTLNGVEYNAIGVSAGHMPIQDNAVYILTVESL